MNTIILMGVPIAVAVVSGAVRAVLGLLVARDAKPADPLVSWLQGLPKVRPERADDEPTPADEATEVRA